MFVFVAGYDDDDSSPVRSKQRPVSMSQSMENLGARTGNTGPVSTLLPNTLYCIVYSLVPTSVGTRLYV